MAPSLDLITFDEGENPFIPDLWPCFHLKLNVNSPRMINRI